MKLAILILNFRTPQLTMDCLASLEMEVAGLGNGEVRVLLLDNASGDDSVPVLEEGIRERGWSAWVDLIAGDTNLGFAGGNSFLMERVLEMEEPPPFMLLLNSDTVVDSGCLEICLRAVQADPRIGAYSCMLRNGDGSVQNVARKLPTPVRATFHALGLPWTLPRLFGWADLDDRGWDREAGARDVEWIGGAFLLTRTDLVRKIGGLDNDFFFYGEDMEFCHRVRKAGHRVLFDPAGSITHLGGASSDPARLLDERKARYGWQARLLVQRKCYGRWAEGWTVWVHRSILRWRRWKQRKEPDSDAYRATVQAEAILRDPWQRNHSDGN